MVGGMGNQERIFPGLYQGTVLEVDQERASEEELDLLKLGWLKVSVFDISDTFAWARPCFSYGHFFVPKAGDRVWLAFEAGNHENPVWLGIWYPQDTVPLLPDETAPEQVQRLIRSESGHVLLFDDTETEEKAPKIEVNSAGGHSLSFDDTEDAATITLSHSGEQKGKVILSKDSVIICFGEQATVTLEDSSITITAGESNITLGSDGIALTFSSSTITLSNDGTTIEGQPINLNP